MAKREVWVYPDAGEPYLKGSANYSTTRPGFSVMSDLPDFKSPIDGKIYSGRTGMREHNSAHNVVPTADLAGLPYLQSNQETRSSSEVRRDRESRKESIIRQVNNRHN